MGAGDLAARLGNEPFVDLVSFRADGSAAHTPVWVSGDGTRLFVSTFGDSWKVRRIRSNPLVAIAACDGPGALLPGASYVAGSAMVLSACARIRQRSRSSLMSSAESERFTTTAPLRSCGLR